jgi:hypothetical protein
LGNTPWAIVDLGWHGRLQKSLETLLKAESNVQTRGFYFALYADSAALAGLDAVSYLKWDLGNPPDGMEVPSLVFLMESFCTAAHGSTVGYRKNGAGRVIPIQRDGVSEPLKNWGISTVHAAVELFARTIEECPFPNALPRWDSRATTVSLLRSFSIEPSPAEARSWGSFPYEDEQGGTVRERLTRSYELTWESLRLALTFGDERFLPSSWKVLWHGAQSHVLSVNNAILAALLRVGALKSKVGRYIRTLKRSAFTQAR